MLDRPIAYFSAEFRAAPLAPDLFGRAGSLAGDHCKEGSDLGVPLVGVGLYYHGGYFDQRIGLDGWQRDSDDPVDPTVNPVVRVHGADGGPCLVPVTISGREVQVGAWRVMVGRIPVYLLDTALDCNESRGRELTARLYTSAPEWRLRQEWILGVGGVRVLRALVLPPRSGTPTKDTPRSCTSSACASSSRRDSLLEAEEQIRATSVFTTHTPVPAGHDVFTPEQLEQVTGRLEHDGHQPRPIHGARQTGSGHAAL